MGLTSSGSRLLQGRPLHFELLGFGCLSFGRLRSAPLPGFGSDLPRPSSHIWREAPPRRRSVRPVLASSRLCSGRSSPPWAPGPGSPAHPCSSEGSIRQQEGVLDLRLQELDVHGEDAFRPEDFFCCFARRFCSSESDAFLLKDGKHLV